MSCAFADEFKNIAFNKFKCHICTTSIWDRLNDIMHPCNTSDASHRGNCCCVCYLFHMKSVSIHQRLAGGSFDGCK